MQTNKKIMLLLILSGPIFLLSGCLVSQEPVEVVLKTDSTGGQPRQNKMAKRFQESAPRSTTVVESAIELSEKYAKLSEEIAVLRQKNQDLITESIQLKNQLTPCEEQLKQTQKELAEANDLLIEMRIELNSWKTDILGFRDEMREADTAQLQTLLKILKMLGGEVKSESGQNEDKSSDAAPMNEPGEPQPRESQAPGKSNE